MIKQKIAYVLRHSRVRGYLLSRRHRRYIKWADAPQTLSYPKPETVSRVGAVFDALYENPFSKWVVGK